MNLKTGFVLFVLAALMVGACNFSISVTNGSGKVISENRSVSDFDHLSLTGIGDVNLTQGNHEALTIEAEDNVIPHIKTDVKDGTLEISFDSAAVIPTKPVKFNLTMKTIHSLESKGVSSLHAPSIQTDRLDVGISGTGNITIDQLKAKTMTINVSGAGNYTANGVVTNEKVTLSGAGNYNGDNLKSSTADVTITGLGRVVVWATESLDVSISGTGGVDYYGSPTVSKNISGLGSLNAKGDK